MTYLTQKIIEVYGNKRTFSQHMKGMYGPGWDEGMISRLCNGKVYPTPYNLRLMCEALSCSAADLYSADELHEMVELGVAGLVDLSKRQEESR